MSLQTQWRVQVATKIQSALGTISASGAGASVIPLTGGSGNMTKQAIASAQIRQDGQQTKGRHGTQATAGSYPGEFQLGNYDAIIEAVMRGTWGTTTSITEATSGLSGSSFAVATSGVTGPSTITFSSGTPNAITAGFKVGDIMIGTVGLATADLAKPLRITAVTATVVTVAEGLTVVAGPVSTYTFTFPGKKLINPTSATRRYWTIEEAELDTDVSEVYQDCVFSKFDMAMAPNGMFTMAPSWVGTGQAAGYTAASSPYFTSPTLPLTTAVPFAAIDASVRFTDTGDIVSLTAWSLSVDIQVTAPPVAASKYSPDVFDGIMQVSGSCTFMRSDLIPFLDFVAETPLSMHVLCKEPSPSTSWFSIFLPYFTLGSATKSAFNRAGGPLTVTAAFPPALVGIDARATGATAPYDLTTVKFQRSTST